MNITLATAPREKLGTYMGVIEPRGPSLLGTRGGRAPRRTAIDASSGCSPGLSTLCLLAGAAALRDVVELARPRLDAASVALVGLGLVGLLYGVSSAFGGSVTVALVGDRGSSRIHRAVRAPAGQHRRPAHQPGAPEGGTLRTRRVANMLALLTIFAMNVAHGANVFAERARDGFAYGVSRAVPAILLSCVISPSQGASRTRHGARVLLPVRLRAHHGVLRGGVPRHRPRAPSSQSPCSTYPSLAAQLSS